MVDERTTNIAIIISAVTGTLLLLFRIPEGIAQWSPYFDALLSSISPTALNWIQNFLIAGFSFIAGWYLKSLRTPSQNPSESTTDSTNSTSTSSSNSQQTSSILQSDSIDTIEGCLEVDGALWRGTAYISDGQLEDVEVPYKPLCPRCQTIIYDHEKESVPVATTATTYWDCPSCGYRTEESINKYDNAQKIFETKFQQIVESEEEEYSLENLVESTPEEVWEDYAEIVSDQQVSTDCFH